MPLKTNATLTFTAYTVTDGTITMTFTSPDPGAGQPSNYTIDVTDADLATVTNGATFATLVQAKLDRKLRATGIASKLDARIGQSLTV